MILLILRSFVLRHLYRGRHTAAGTTSSSSTAQLTLDDQSARGDVTGASSASDEIFLNSVNHAKATSVNQLTDNRSLSSGARVKSVLFNSDVVTPKATP